MAKAVELGQRWMKGVCAEHATLILRPQTEQTMLKSSIPPEVSQ